MASKLAVNAFVRGLLQTFVVTAVVAAYEAVRAYASTVDVMDWNTVQTVAANAAGVAVLGALYRVVQTGRLEPVPWDVDAWIRSGRTLVTGGLITVGAFVVQAVQAAVGRGEFSPEYLVHTALVAAGMAGTAWVHRLFVDRRRFRQRRRRCPVNRPRRGRPSTR
jgi:hypothetical protein